MIFRRGRRSLILPLVVLAIAAIISRLDVLDPGGAPEKPESGTFSGRCVGIADGDTIRVMRGGREVEVRLWGVDAPEKRQGYGTAARNFTSRMVFGRKVSVEVRERDRYGRSVGWVRVDGKVLNLELVKGGMAWWYHKYAPNASDLRAAERSARSARRGLWKDRSPTPPWDFRRPRRQRTGLPALFTHHSELRAPV